MVGLRIRRYVQVCNPFLPQVARSYWQVIWLELNHFHLGFVHSFVGHHLLISVRYLKSSHSLMCIRLRVLAQRITKLYSTNYLLARLDRRLGSFLLKSKVLMRLMRQCYRNLYQLSIGCRPPPLGRGNRLLALFGLFHQVLALHLLVPKNVLFARLLVLNSR